MNTTQAVYVILAAGMMLSWLTLIVVGPRRIDVPSVLVVLRYSSMLRTIALGFALIPPLIMIYVIWTFFWRTPTMLNIAGLSFLVSGIITGLPLIEYTRVQIVVTEDGITRYSPWSGSVVLNWIDVERIGYSSVNQWFTIAGAGSTIRVSRYLVGIGVFVATVRRKVAAERCTSATAMLDAAK